MAFTSFLIDFGTSVEVLISPSLSTTVLTPLFATVHHNFFEFFVRWLRAAAVSYWQIYLASQVWLKERDQTLSRGAKKCLGRTKHFDVARERAWVGRNTLPGGQKVIWRAVTLCRRRTPR